MSPRKSGAQWVEQLHSPDEKLAHRARLRLGSLGREDGWMVSDLIVGTRDPDDYTRFWATSGLLQIIEVAADVAGPRLLELLADPYPAVRAMALGGIRHAGLEDEGVGTMIDLAETDRVAHVREEAVRCLGRVSNRVAPKALAGLTVLLAVPGLEYVSAIAAKSLLIADGRPQAGDEIALRRALEQAMDAEPGAALQAKLALKYLRPSDT